MRVGDVMNQEAIKPAQTKLSHTCCVFTSTLCEIVYNTYLVLSVITLQENRYGEQATTSF